MKVGARLTFLLGVLTALAPAALDSYVPALPEMSRDLGVGPTPVQLTITGFLVGLACGQLLAGPLSDRFGRRRPLLVGLVAFTAISLLCAVAANVWVLIGLRVLQGVAGAAGMVIARAIVRDLHRGTAAARFFAMLMLISGLAPIVAPLLGGALLRYGSWRDIFAGLGVLGALAGLGAWVTVRETLPPERRQKGGLRQTVGSMRELLRDRPFVGCVLSCGFVFGAMFCYLSGAPFVLQDIYGLSPQLFALVLAGNSAGVIATSQTSRFVVDRVGPRLLLSSGVYGCALGCAALLVGVLAGAGLWVVLPCLFVVVGSLGFVLPNAAALALANQPLRAGSAAALLGVTQYSIGGLVAPVVGIAGRDTAVPMALAMALLSGGAVVAIRWVVLSRAA